MSHQSHKIDELILYSGNDIIIPDTQLVLHQPTIKEIGRFGEVKWTTALSILDINKNNIQESNQLNEKITDFNILLEIMNAKNQQQEQQNIIECFTNFLLLLFPKYNIKFNKKNIEFIFLENETIKNYINHLNFVTFRGVIKQIFNLEDIETTTYQNTATQKLVEKFKKRKAILAKQQNNTKNSNEEALLKTNIGTMVSVLSVSSGVDANAILEYNYYRLVVDYKRALYKNNYDTVQRCRLAGAKIEEDPHSWLI